MGGCQAVEIARYIVGFSEIGKISLLDYVMTLQVSYSAYK